MFKKALDLASRLLPLLKSTRAEIYSEWINIGWTLFNIGNGTIEAQELWLTFSKRAGVLYDETACICAWNKMVKKNKTIGSLIFVAKQDNPTECNKILIECTSSYMNNTLKYKINLSQQTNI